MQDQRFLSPNRALRVTLAFEEGKFRVLESQILTKRAPASDEILDPDKDEQQSGFWIELRDANGRALYRHILHDPLQLSVEIHSEDKDRPIRRETNPNPKGVLNLLLPDLPGAETLVIVSSPLNVQAMFEPASDLVSFSLAKLKEGRDGRI